MSTGSLDTRPGAITLGLDDLVELAGNGRIRVPHFQRGFKWTARDVIRLFDSIVRRYPVGSLLLWRRPAASGSVVLGALEIEAPDFDEALWVVDGQQRITSLVNVLRPGTQHDARFALGYDLREARVVSLPSVEDPFIIPLHVVFDLSQVLDWFAEHPEASDARETAFDLAKHLRETTVPAYQVVEDDVGVLQDIFDRMNNYGKRLSRAEVFSALNAGPESDRDDERFESIAERIDRNFNFGRIDSDTILRAILARRGPDIQREIRREFDISDRRGVREFRDEGRDAAFIGGEEALALAVRFAINNGVPHMTVLPYRYLLIVLTRVLAHHPEPDPVNAQLLARWFWRAALLGPEIFKGSATGAARALCGRVDPENLTKSVQNLLASLERVEPEFPRLSRFRTNTAAAKITICSWWEIGPRDPSGRAAISESGEPYLEFPLYTTSELAEALIDRGTAADAIRSLYPTRLVPDQLRLAAANRVLLPVLTEPTNVVYGLLQERPGGSEKGWSEVLDSLVFPSHVQQSLIDGEIESTLLKRQVALEELLQSFIQRKCGWTLEDTPPLSEFELEDLEGEDDGVA